MSRATTKGGSTLGPKTVIAFLVGVGIGFALVVPVLPDTFGATIAAMVQGGGAVILIGVAALATLMVLLAVLYQGYLKA